MKKILLALLVGASLQAQLTFDYEPEMIELVSNLNAASINDLIKVQTQALKWISRTVDDHRRGIYRLNTQEVAYLRYISEMLTEICFELGEV